MLLSPGSTKSIHENDFMFFFFSSRRRHTRFDCDWSSDVCSSDLGAGLFRDAAVRPVVFPEPADHWRRGDLGGADAEGLGLHVPGHNPAAGVRPVLRSEERRVGKECRSRWSPYHLKKKKKRKK